MTEIRNWKRFYFEHLLIWDFGLVSDFDIRISDFWGWYEAQHLLKEEDSGRSSIRDS